MPDTAGAPDRLGSIYLPDLRVVATRELVLHEDSDERRVSGMAHRLQAEGLLKNPPIVASMGEDGYVVLDGANRVSALRRLGVPDTLVQIVDYDDCQLSTWYHLITEASPDALLAAAGQIEGVRLRPDEQDRARRALDDDRILAFLVQPDGQVLSFADPTAADLAARTERLRQIVSVYKGRANIHRVQSDDMSALGRYYADIAGLIVFPAYRPADVLDMARRGAVLPSGITRHRLPLRALRTNIELSFLWSDHPRSEKNRWLVEWTRNKIQLRAIRHYEEQTVLYDE